MSHASVCSNLCVCVCVCVRVATTLRVSVEADLAQAGGGGMWAVVAGFNVPTSIYWHIR